jgi:hypothetical protein
MPHFMKVHVHWMNLMKNQIIQECQSLEGRGYKAKDSFKKLFDQKIMFNGFKIFNFRFRSLCKK